MELKSIVFEPKAEVTFTRQEVEALLHASICHYDRVCISLSETPTPGGGSMQGLLRGLKNQLEFSETDQAVRVFTFRELDTLAKVCESPLMPRDMNLGILIGVVLRRLNEEYREKNPS